MSFNYWSNCKPRVPVVAAARRYQSGTSRPDSPTRKARQKMKKEFLTALLFSLASNPLTYGSEISWVDFSSWPAESTSRTALSSSTGLALDAEFAGTMNMRSGVPVGVTQTVADALWPFSNSDFPGVSVISVSPFVLSTTLTFDFTSSGGLPAGGSIAVVDLESIGSSVQLTGFKSGVIF